MTEKDTFPKLVLVSIGVFLSCSLIVAMAVIFLMPHQKENHDMEQKRQILMAAALTDDTAHSPSDIQRAFESIETLSARFEDGTESTVYLAKTGGTVDQIILPFTLKYQGDTLRGYLSLAQDLTTVKREVSFPRGTLPQKSLADLVSRLTGPSMFGPALRLLQDRLHPPMQSTPLPSPTTGDSP